ncbi:hypothetical protein [Bacillus sp. REN16]|uniref:hypothetical protein n=1 Tax=Bacillus sp. REN16 TaxID=2887296 RepID=UPI001E56DA46|nr:hypothetical protein [Bacillus sp. REN16]MCC3358758.1 hypothetical protein [Bacillus sp. REN16]
MNKEDDKDMTIQSPTIEPAQEQELSFQEKLKLLSKSVGTVDIGENSDQICREVRGKE